MDTFKTVITLVVLLLGVPLLICWLNDKIFHQSASKTERDEYSKRFEERLLNPNIPALEKHFSCSFPEVLKSLYANKEEIVQGDCKVKVGENRYDIAGYNPADLESVTDAWPDCENYFAFADDGCGNSYLVDVRTANPEVLFYDHEGGEFEKVGLSLSEFLAAAKG